MSYHEDPASLPGDLDHLGGFFDPESDRLLDEDINPFPHAVNRNGRVQLIGKGYRNRVKPGVPNHRSMV
jgi:hypothetical protein